MLSKIFLFLFSAVALIPLHARAGTSEWASADQVRVRLVSAVDVLGTEEMLEGGLEIQLSEGWHTYWKIPGDAGLAPQFDWAASGNMASAVVLWAMPERKEEAGLQIFGYSDRVFLPLRITRKDKAQPLNLNLALQIMVCKEICIPQDLQVSMNIQAGAQSKLDSSIQALIGIEKRKLPSAEDTEILKTTTVVVGKDALAVGVYAKNGFDHADMMAHTEDILLTARPVLEKDSSDPHRAILTIPKPEGVENLNDVLAGKMLHLFLTDGRSAIEKDIQL